MNELTDDDRPLDLLQDEARDVVELERLCGQHPVEVGLALLVHVEPHLVELLENLLGGVEPPDAPVVVKQNLHSMIIPFSYFSFQPVLHD